MNRLITLFFFCLMLNSVNSFSQELKGDVLWVNAFTPATVRFPDKITSAMPGCDDGLYVITTNENKLVINPVAEKKPPMCRVMVEEGGRKHMLKVYFQDNDADIDLDKSFLDLHTIDLLKQRVAQVEANKQNQQGAGSGGKETVLPPPPPVDPPPPPAQSVTPPPVIKIDSDYDFDGIKYSRAQLREAAMTKITKFNQNLVILAKPASPERKQTIIDNIMTFFRSDKKVTVEVRNKGKEPSHYPILDYLKRFSNLSYTTINIQNSELTFVGKFYKNEDGTYRGIVVAQQTFTAYNERGVAYTDVTTKDYEIKVKVIEQYKDGEVRKFIDVFLGNISITEDKKQQ